MRKILSLLIIAAQFAWGSQADLIVFSYDRPLQLHALLESVSKFVSNLNQTSVLYRVSNPEISQAYDQLKEMHPSINWVRQGPNPRQDFKPLLLNSFSNPSADYVLFAVDDDLVKDSIDMQECVEILEKTDAYCFYFRLGENITRQYCQDDVTLIPPRSTEVKENIYQYLLSDGSYGDWRYPNNLDMTLYKKEKIQSFFVTASYHSPNTLEGKWSGFANLNEKALFFKTSKMFSLPINIVQEDWVNPCEKTFSAKELFALWKEGFMMDPEPYYRLNNSCAFVTLRPTFKKR